MNTPSIGADPKLFLETETGQLRSAIGLFGGSKEAPRHLERIGFALQEDNVALEFNIPPAETVEEFVNSIQWSISRINQEAEGLGLRPTIRASAKFPNSELLDPKSHQFGCDPDFNAWTIPVEMNSRPMVEDNTFRSCGGHIHVGLCKVPEENEFRILDFVRAMDLYLGVPSVGMDEDKDRRQLYGKAGAHRLTSYGFEYRTLSNFWLKSPALTRWAYTQTQRAYKWVLSFYNQENLDGMWSVLSDDIQKCINTGDVYLCQHLCTEYNLELVNVR